MENEVCFRAEICKKNKMHIILMVITVIFFILCVLAFIPLKSGELHNKHIPHMYNIYGKNLFRYTYMTWTSNLIVYDWTKAADPIFFINFIVFSFALILICYEAICKPNTLEINPYGISGKKKRFLYSSINVPFEKIDNIYVKECPADKLLGGKTVVVRSVLLWRRFSGIANAQEFVDKTLEELKKYKSSVSSNKENTLAVSDADAIDSILKLKNLLDQGLITQEEFEEKRKSFINKI